MDRKQPIFESSEWKEALLWQYLKGELPEQEQARVRLAMEQEPFLQDALEGLGKEGGGENAVRDSVLLLQQHLKKHVYNRRKRRAAVLKPKLWLWLAVLALLLFVFVAWWMIRLMGVQ